MITLRLGLKAGCGTNTALPLGNNFPSIGRTAAPSKSPTARGTEGLTDLGPGDEMKSVYSWSNGGDITS